MAGWHDTLDVMIDLESWWRSPVGIKFGDGFIRSVEMTAPEMVGAEVNKLPGWLAAVARGQIVSGDPFFVTDEVFELVDEASKRFEPEPFQATDLLTTSGFVLFPRSFYTKDINGRVVNTRAFSWGPCGTQESQRIGEAAPAIGTYLMLYSDPDDTKDDSYENLQEVREVWGTTGLSLWHVSPWWFGYQLPKIENFNDVDPNLVSHREMWKWIQVFFRLSMQQIVTGGWRIPSRPFARRAKRAGRDPGIMVLTLRRPKHLSHNGDSEPREWDFRWLVRGHWRNQWYPSLGEHRQIWVTPYVKGPEDKPFRRPALRAWSFRR